MSLQSIIEWKLPAEEMPDAEITVLMAFADGDVLLGFYGDDCWRNMEGLAYGTHDKPLAWADLPEVPECLVAIAPPAKKEAR